MGHGASCGRPSEEVDFFGAAQSGDLTRLAAALRSRPTLLSRTTLFDRLSALHIAAAHGHLQVVSLALDLCVHPDVVNRHKQIVMFDSSHGRTCLHYAAYYGHADCLRTILSAAKSAPVSQSWLAFVAPETDTTVCSPLMLFANLFSAASDAEVCSICFEQACSIEVRECGHQMCAACTLALCCHAKPNPATQSQPVPTCPFCRGGIAALVVATTRPRAGDDDDEGSRLASPRHRRSRKSMNLSGDAGSTSSTLMGSIASSIGKMGRRRTDSSEQVDDKP
ncbi:hypothetical protein HU200_025045 [Digitaria exilis]|uniref:RING-type E3 ubiquitin transferase n=1 Tax=Digitaria exilis TaxID=1010633 RepID=A0A835EVJ4_9POAL|nr:hypothetical protein HU200_025045 [Digitaria exilis]